MAEYLNTHISTDYDALSKLERTLSNYDKLQKKSEEELFTLKKNNLDELARLKVAALNKEAVKEEELNQRINKRLLNLQIKVEKERLAYIAKAEEEAKAKKKSGKLTKKEKEAIQKEAEEKIKIEQSVRDRIQKEEKKKAEKAEAETIANAVKDAWGNSKLHGITAALFGGNAARSALEEAGYSSKDAKKASKVLQFKELTNALNDFAKQLEGTINDIASMQTAVDTRLQGSNGRTWHGSQWKAMNQDIIKFVGMSPFVKQADVVNNLKTMVGRGIAFNVEQRAFLATVKDSIADTFNATQESLVKLVRIQQQDTTAARLGMESALTSFLNNMYETTEYMTDMANQVKNNIYEASALMTAKSATEFEYQVQKWMGSLYSVGFSTDITSALGELAAGKISSISNGGIGNLLVMAANRANMSIADILSDGLDASETNQLMQAMVSYLGGIYSETKGSNILAQQYANVFGLTASDLKAAANLSSDIGAISKNNLNYGGMLGRLSTMASTMGARMSMGGMMTNLIDNFKYATANSLANSPLLYATYSLANMLSSTVGEGLNFSLPLVAGTGITQSFNIPDIMRAGAVAGGLLSGIGTMLSGIGQQGTGLGMLKGFGIGAGDTYVNRGNGKQLITTGGNDTSESGYVGSGNGSDVQNKTMQEATDSATQQISAAEENSEDKTLNDVDSNLVKIYTLLQDVVTGGQSIKVDMGNSSSWSQAFKEGIL